MFLLTDVVQVLGRIALANVFSPLRRLSPPPRSQSSQDNKTIKSNLVYPTRPPMARLGLTETEHDQNLEINYNESDV